MQGDFKIIGILGALIISLSLNTARAQTQPVVSRAINEKKLGQALQKYRNFAELEVKFKQTKLLKDMDVPLTSEGELRLKPPGVVIFQLTKPSPLLVTLTPELISIESGSGSGKTVQKIKTGQVPAGRERASLQAMVNWLKMDAKVLSETYFVSEDANANYVFKPRFPEQSPFLELRLKLTAEGHVKNIRMSEVSGDKMEFAFETPKVNYKK